ncbi:MAG: CBS and ACT domain-containing protein [Deferribacterales bacterium]
MYVKDWMTKTVFTVDINDSVVAAVRLMREKNIKHIPVMDNGRLKGLVSDRKLKEYLPSKGTCLDVYEMNYLLENTKMSEIMGEGVFVAEPNLPIEEAALMMMEHNIGCLPVVEKDTLTGIISDKDIFKAMIDITGGSKKGYRITFILEDISGSIRAAGDVVRSCGFGIESILSGHIDLKDKRKVVIRTRGSGDAVKMKNDILEKYPDAEILFRG